MYFESLQIFFNRGTTIIIINTEPSPDYRLMITLLYPYIYLHHRRGPYSESYYLHSYHLRTNYTSPSSHTCARAHTHTHISSGRHIFLSHYTCCKSPIFRSVLVDWLHQKRFEEQREKEEEDVCVTIGIVKERDCSFSIIETQ